MIWLNRLFEIPVVAWLLVIATALWVRWARKSRRNAFDNGRLARPRRGMTGGETAREILRLTDLETVTVAETARLFRDFYDPGPRVLRLSREVYEEAHITAIGLAAHEAGHALQHARGDAPMPLELRSMVALAVRLGPPTALVLALTGITFEMLWLVVVGAMLLAGSAALPLLTLRLERDASHRARRALAMTGLLESEQQGTVDAVLDAAAWSEVAAVLPPLGGGRRSRSASDTQWRPPGPLAGGT